MSPPTAQDLEIKTLGTPRFPSPLGLSHVKNDEIPDYTPDERRITLQVEFTRGDEARNDLAFERAGPRETIYFNPATTRAGIVTCGGLCPGINNVVRSAVLELHHKYRVEEVLGFRYGFQGLNPARSIEPLTLTNEHVRSIHRQGGSFLGVSRGAEDPRVMVDTLERLGINLLLCVGGDGTLRGAHAIHEEAARRGMELAVVGVPKTIDNDVAYVDKTFGFDTAVEVARSAIDAAHAEASGAYNGIGLVKLMGRDSGFIAACATLASLDVNFCLIPEVHFDLDGDHGLLAALEERLASRHHAVIVVAEGCARSLVGLDTERDASGNVRYNADDVDIGPRLRDAIVAHFKKRHFPVTLKYIDPSYVIRSGSANASDSIFSDSLARHAVHAGMSGKTDLAIGRWHDVFTHVPLSLATSERKHVDPDGGLWLAVTETTGQPSMSAGGRHSRMPPKGSIPARSPI